jgi:hypothetical protein
MHSKYNLAAQYNSLSSSKNPLVNLLIECDFKNSQYNTLPSKNIGENSDLWKC